MSNGFKILATLGLVGFLAACGRQAPEDEVVYVEPTQPQPVQPEPTFNKY